MKCSQMKFCRSQQPYHICVYMRYSLSVWLKRCTHVLSLDPFSSLF